MNSNFLPVSGSLILLASSNEELVRLQASGGIVAGYTKEDIEMWTNAMERCLLCAGVNKNDIIQNSGGLGVHYGVEALGAAVVPTDGNSSKGPTFLLNLNPLLGFYCLV